MNKMDKTMGKALDGGSAIVRWFKGAGIKHVYSVSGGPINAIYRACAAEEVQLVHTRHEAAAGYMAEAAARVTGTPAALVVTLGPGVTNAVTPALVSNLGGTPLLIVGAQSATAADQRGAGMSFDVLPTMRSVTKWAARCTDPSRLQEYLDIAWRKMWAGRPGPVFLEVPTDVLHMPLESSDAATTGAPVMPGRAGLDAADWRAAADMLTMAKRPVVLLGDETFFDRSTDLQPALEKHGLPFATLRLARGIVDERHPLWAGPGYAPCNGALRKALDESDCVLVLGHHFEFDLEFGDKLGKTTRVIQIASDPELLHRNRRAEIAINAAPSAFIKALAALDPLTIDRDWVGAFIDDWRAERAAQLGEGDAKGIHPVAAVDAVSSAVSDEAIFVTSHGNVDFWADARLQVKAPGRYLRAGQSGTLGAEVPYGAGAAFADPDVPVIVLVGDGGVGYHVTELDTAERYGRAFIIVVLDDELWGAIALPQDQSFGETYEMDLPRRDWAKVAEGLGGEGYFARTPEEIDAAVKQAIASGKPAIIQVPVRSVMSPYMNYIS
jgi:acetolactate synthase-1/2/3 large subunit